MPKKTNKKQKISSNVQDVHSQIEIATQTLERNIGFISNCDNKTSIVLASIGVLMTIILTNDGLKKNTPSLRPASSRIHVVAFCIYYF